MYFNQFFCVTVHPMPVLRYKAGKQKNEAM